MSITCNIEFDNNPLCTFYGGQILNTKISLFFKDALQIKGIAFKIHGYAEMHWSDDDDSYSGEEDYINMKTFLLGTPTSEATTLDAGVHVFSHSFALPITCPSSVESQYGQIRYQVKVMLIRPWKLEKSFTKPFTVLKLVDLNSEPMAARSITKDLEKKESKSGLPFEMSVSLPQSGYVPGQIIPINVSIANGSDKMIKELKVSLVMIVSCYSKRPTQHVFDCVLKVSKLKNKLLEDQNKHNSTYELLVPLTPPMDNDYSTVIHVSYQVEVEAVMPIMQSNQVIILPVYIGNVPLVDQSKRIVTHDCAVADTKEELKHHKVDNDSSSMPISPPWENGASSIPPPTFEAATFMPPVNINENGEHSSNDSEFVPRYPVFNVPIQTLPNKKS